MSSKDTPENTKDPIGGDIPLATPPTDKQGEGFVQIGVTNTNLDPEKIVQSKKDQPD